MKIEYFDQADRICVLRLQGRFQTGSDAAFQDARERLKAMGCRGVVINCRGVPYLDSTGIGFLVGLFTTMRNAGGSFALAEVGQRINNVLRLTTLNTVLAVYDTEAEALRAVIEGNARPQVRWVGNEAT